MGPDPNVSGVENLQYANICQRLFQSFNVEASIHAVGQPPDKHFAAELIVTPPERGHDSELEI